MPLSLLYTYLSKIAAQGKSGIPAFLTLAMVSSIVPAAAQDWGYDAPPQTGTSAPTSKSAAKAAASTLKTPSKPLVAPAAKSTQKAGMQATAVQPAGMQPAVIQSAAPAQEQVDDKRSWLEIFALCASSNIDDDRTETLGLATLSGEQKDSLGKMIDQKLAANASVYAGIAPFWRQTRVKVIREIDSKESYRLLFRALIRHALSAKNSPLAKNQNEADLLQSLLGAARIADPGPPPLTEDAVNAYADMTVFLFSKRKPDRSVDGDENRKVFADVIKDRFVRAPNPAAKAAMTNFDLTWACFRCRFLDVDAEQKEKLSALMASGDSKSSAMLKQELVSPAMTKLFAMGPWGEKSVKSASAQSQ